MDKVQFSETSKCLGEAKGFIRQCGFDYGINPAIGCRFGCSYCYAANFTQRMAPPGAEWGDWTKLKSSSATEIANHRSLSGKSIYMSTSTDPYQPAESKAEITKGILESLCLPHHDGVKLVIQTRSPLVTRDIELFQHIHKSGLLQVNMTISTDSDVIRKRFEPTCPSISARLKAVETLIANGIQCAITVTPMLPLEDISGFADKLASLGLSSVVIQPFHEKRDAANIRSTRDEALDILDDMGLTLQDLRDQANRLWYALKRRGVVVGVNQSGFNVPNKIA